MAGALFVLGCGVPLPPESVAATATADAAQARQNVASELASQPGDVRSASSNVAASGLDATPLATRDPSLVDETDEEDEAPRESEATPTGTPAPSPSPQASATPVAAAALQAPAQSNASFGQEFVNLLNTLRTGRGLSALAVNASLVQAGNAYAAYMGGSNFFGHFGPDGSSPRSRITAAGYRGSYKGEALTAGQPTPQSALNALLASPPHAAILLEPSAVEIGVGYAYQAGSTYSHYWVVVTGVP